MQILQLREWFKKVKVKSSLHNMVVMRLKSLGRDQCRNKKVIATKRRFVEATMEAAPHRSTMGMRQLQPPSVPS